MSCQVAMVPAPPNEPSSRVNSFQSPLGAVSWVKIEVRVAVPAGGASGHDPLVVQPPQPVPAGKPLKKLNQFVAVPQTAEFRVPVVRVGLVLQS